MPLSGIHDRLGLFSPHIHNPHSLILKPTPQPRGGKLKKKKTLLCK